MTPRHGASAVYAARANLATVLYKQNRFCVSLMRKRKGTFDGENMKEECIAEKKTLHRNQTFHLKQYDSLHKGT